MTLNRCHKPAVFLCKKMEDNHPAWAKRFYKSRAWQRARRLAYDRAGGLCEICLKRGRITPGEIVHHIKPMTPEAVKDPSLALGLDNLMLLCRDCHGEIHQIRKPRYKVGPDGKVSRI